MKYLRILMLTAGLILIAGSAGFLVKNHVRAAEARAWPSAQGRIIASEVRTLQATEVGNKGDFLPYVRYDYVVQGRTFHGDTIWLDERRSFGSVNVAARELAFLEAGSPVEVRYNPANPREAALNIEENAWPKIFLLMFGLLLAGFGWRWRPKAQAALQATPDGIPAGMQMAPGMQMPPGLQMQQAGMAPGPERALPAPPPAPDVAAQS